jgi:uncharacterized protein (TIGR03083 family)
MSTEGRARPELPELLTAYRKAARQVCLLLGSLEHTADVTPGGEWTVRQTAVHLICFPRLFRQFLDGSPSPLSSMADTEIMNTAFFLAMDAEDPHVLAALLDAGTDAYANDAATHRANDPCPFHLGMTLDVATEVAIQTSELLQHGWDIAQATHRTFRDDQGALTVLLAMPELWATLLPPSPSRQTGTLAICPSNDPCYVYMLDPQRTSVSRAITDHDWDCAVSGPPFQMLLWLGRRATLANAGLTVSGPKPALVGGFRS